MQFIKNLKPETEARIRKSLAAQGLMQTFGVEMTLIEEGRVIMECPFSERLSQQNGYFHAGVLTSVVDSACGYAAYTLMPEDSDVLSVEFKINFMRPAKTDKIIAEGKVIQAGKNLVVCDGWVRDAGGEKILAKMLATMMVIRT